MQIVPYRVRFECSINLPYRRINKHASAANNFSSFEGAISTSFFFFLFLVISSNLRLRRSPLDQCAAERIIFSRSGVFDDLPPLD